MRMRRGWLSAVLVLGSGALWAAGDAGPDYAKLRAERARDLTRPDGWFSLVALAPLQQGSTTVGSAPGNAVILKHVPARWLTVRMAGGAVTVEQGGRAVPADPEHEDDAHAFRSGGVLLWAIDRGGRKYLRVKDAEAPTRVDFHGLRWYPAQAKYRIAGKWVPYTTPHTMDVPNKLGQVEHHPVPGYAEFVLDGKTERLTPFDDDGDWMVAFRDATGRSETDGGGRFLNLYPSNGVEKPGTVTVDFNLARNPPCAYTAFATCPLAPRENRLAEAVPAGEKRYGDD